MIGTSALIQSSPASSSGAKQLQQGLELQESSCSFKHLMSKDPFLTCRCVLLTVVLTRVLSFVHLLCAGCLLPSPSERFVCQHWAVYVESQSCKLLGVDGPLYSELQQNQQGTGFEPHHHGCNLCILTLEAGKYFLSCSHR